MTAQGPVAEARNDTVTTHLSRTLMFSELELLFEAVPISGELADYQHAALEDNALLKRTLTNRKKTFSYLRGLYVLEPSHPLFGPFRQLWQENKAGREVLALLVALARDTVLKATAEVVLRAEKGSILPREAFSEAVRAAFPQLGAKTLVAVGQRTASSWLQSGHLQGVQTKRRVQVSATPAAVALAMYLGHRRGERGLRLFETLWARVLDASPHDLDTLAFAAAQRGWLEYKRIADVAEFGFERFERLTRFEKLT